MIYSVHMWLSRHWARLQLHLSRDKKRTLDRLIKANAYIKEVKRLREATYKWSCPYCDANCETLSAQLWAINDVVTVFDIQKLATAHITQHEQSMRLDRGRKC